MSTIRSGLIIDEPWIGKILSGTKVWETGSTRSSIREPIALIRKGSGAVVGVARMINRHGPINRAQTRKRATPSGFHDQNIYPANQPIYLRVEVMGLARPSILRRISLFTNRGAPALSTVLPVSTAGGTCGGNLNFSTYIKSPMRWPMRAAETKVLLSTKLNRRASLENALANCKAKKGCIPAHAVS